MDPTMWLPRYSLPTEQGQAAYMRRKMDAASAMYEYVRAVPDKRKSMRIVFVQYDVRVGEKPLSGPAWTHNPDCQAMVGWTRIDAPWALCRIGLDLLNSLPFRYLFLFLFLS